MADIFLSYSHLDREWISAFAGVLAERGWSVFWDRRIPIGRHFDEVIEQELDAAKCVVVIWSKNSAASSWVKTEASEAATKGILYPVLMEAVKVPFEFRRLQTASLVDWRPGIVHSEFDQLILDITRLLPHEDMSVAADSPHAQSQTPAAPLDVAAATSSPLQNAHTHDDHTSASLVTIPAIITACGLTHPGRLKVNEDAIGVFAEDRLFVVADGLDGQGYGRVASARGVGALATFFRRFHDDPRAPWPHPVDFSTTLGANLLRVGIKVANDEVRTELIEDQLAGQRPSRSTITALAVGDAQVSVASIGDSRAYKLHRGQMTCLTCEHPVLDKATGGINIDGVERLGDSDEADPVVWIGSIQAGDTYLLCTAGLWRAVPDHRIVDIVQSAGSTDAACRALVEVAKSTGPTLDISAILIRLD